MRKFSLGVIVGTTAAVAALERNNQLPTPFLERHESGDWGEISEEDKKENDLSVEDESRILSVYSLEDGTKIWILTENDRSVTTLLLPDDIRKARRIQALFTVSIPPNQNRDKLKA
jgi:hypothetical protein